MRKYELQTIKHFADSMFHCGDYGQTYIKDDLSEVYIVLGDADDPDLDAFREFVEGLGIQFTVEAEVGPNLNEYWLLSLGTETEFPEDDPDFESGYICPQSTPREYIIYDMIMNRLDD